MMIANLYSRHKNVTFLPDCSLCKSHGGIDIPSFGEAAVNGEVVPLCTNHFWLEASAIKRTTVVYRMTLSETDM